jgi:hypothetical protein
MNAKREQSLSVQLLKLQTQFNKTKEEVEKIYHLVSGRVNLVQDYLDGKEVLIWYGLEDELL